MWSAVPPPHPNQTQRPASALHRRGQYLASFRCTAAFSAQPSPEKGLCLGLRSASGSHSPTQSFTRAHASKVLFELIPDGVLNSLCYNAGNADLLDRCVTTQSMFLEQKR